MTEGEIRAVALILARHVGGVWPDDEWTRMVAIEIIRALRLYGKREAA